MFVPDSTSPFLSPEFTPEFIKPYLYRGGRGNLKKYLTLASGEA